MPDRVVKSHGAERTYAEDIREFALMRSQLDGLALICGEWLARKGLRAGTVTLKVRYDDFSTVTRSLSPPGGVHDTPTIATHAQQLLDRTEAAARPVRLLGVSVHNLVDPSASWVGGDGHLPFEASEDPDGAATTPNDSLSEDR